jgi:hypothetical protein
VQLLVPTQREPGGSAGDQLPYLNGWGLRLWKPMRVVSMKLSTATSRPVRCLQQGEAAGTGRSATGPGWHTGG